MTNTTALTLSDYLYIANDTTGAYAVNMGKVVDAVNAGQLAPSAIDEIGAYSGYYVQSVKDPITGKYNYTTYSNIAERFGTNPVNSNASTVARGNVSRPLATTIDGATGKVVTAPVQGVGSKVFTAASKLAVPLTMAAIGVTLGKTIDETLYNANPDFWDSIGASAINPQTWSSIAGQDENGRDFINAIFGIDPETGESQAYIDANALAYLAYCMSEAGIFAQSSGIVQPTDKSGMIDPNRSIPNPIPTGATQIYRGGLVSQQSASVSTCVSVGYMWDGGSNKTAASIFWYGTEPFTVYDSVRGTTYNSTARTYQGNTYYICNPGYFFNRAADSVCSPAIPLSHTSIGDYDFDMAYLIFNGTPVSPVPGIGNQTGATTPDFNGLSESDYLPYLQQQYPDMFNNAINYPVAQTDGSVDNHTYVPITLPQANTNLDTQPTSGTQTQQQPAIDPATSPQPLIDLLTQLLQVPPNNIDTEQKPPENPSDTGDGSTPTPTAPTGSASALWAIYHPTQSEIDSFGAWLWSSNFIDQIAKIFNNPMESIIGLHKVYATPIDAGMSTIGVGYLDSGVSSAYITQQYVDVNCGTVDLFEQFGNVFDYAPFTSVKLYLPFIGIVNLDVAEVMRSSISVSYGVDVITGACLARVTISRDGNSNILYQFAGNCAVQYPLSMGSYMGVVSSIIGVAGSVAATVATGGGVAPLALGAMGGMLNAKTSVQNSGNFSGNAGAMGGKIPYLIIERPQTRMVDNQQEFSGTPTNEYKALGEYSGFVRCRDAHVIDINATDSEQSELMEYLAGGVIV